MKGVGLVGYSNMMVSGSVLGKIKYWIVLVIVLGILSAFTLAYANEDILYGTMQRANQLYEQGLYYEASQTYQQLADQGVKDASLFYNLGNA